VSLILDALRKADAERERGAVPGLHAQPVPPLSVEPPAPANARPLLWIVIGAIVGLVSALGAYFASLEPPPAPAAAAAPELPVAPVRADTSPTAPAESAQVAAPAPWPAKETRSAPAEPAAAPTAKARADVKTERVARAAPSEPPPIVREQLPTHLRAELPPLAVGGSMYSATPANRSLIIDGRLYREGDQVASALILETIGLKSAVLSYKGYRFEIRF
jgi:general secretion pathway protein B